MVPENELEREVVILISDMIHYSHKTARMRPEQVRDFILDYHKTMQLIVGLEEYQPAQVEPQAGDGALLVFDKKPGQGREEVCTRALKAAMALSAAIDRGHLAPTRMGLHLGEMIEARLGDRDVKFGSSFAVATRLEELCDYFGTTFLIDSPIAESIQCCRENVVSIGMLSLKSFSAPLEVFTVYRPGINGFSDDIDTNILLDLVRRKNEAMSYFSGSTLHDVEPDFPKARDMLIDIQTSFVNLTGNEDKPVSRILEYIREHPLPDRDFQDQGIQLSQKKRDTLGARLYHLSGELLKAINHEFYHALVVDTDWEKYFKLEWRKKGETIIQINDEPDGVYFIDIGEVLTLNENQEVIARLSAGTIFGEMAYFSEERRRTATVIAGSDVVIRRISSEDFQQLPVIQEIFKRISEGRR